MASFVVGSGVVSDPRAAHSAVAHVAEDRRKIRNHSSTSANGAASTPASASQRSTPLVAAAPSTIATGAPAPTTKRAGDAAVAAHGPNASDTGCCAGAWPSRRRRSNVADYRRWLCDEDWHRLLALHAALGVPYDTEDATHEEALMRLWQRALPGVALTGRTSPQWQQLGFQGSDPATDFRGSGFASLEMMHYFATHRSERFRDFVAHPPTYGFSVAAINVLHILKFHLALVAHDETSPVFLRYRPSRRCMKPFAHLFAAYRNAFEEVFCDCLELCDTLWLRLVRREPKATVMDFPRVFKWLCRCVTRALTSLPSYAMLDDFQPALIRAAACVVPRRRRGRRPRASSVAPAPAGSVVAAPKATDATGAAHDGGGGGVGAGVGAGAGSGTSVGPPRPMLGKAHTGSSRVLALKPLQLPVSP